MKITSIQIDNLRGFQKMQRTELSKSINVFIGPNNAGKSTILNSIFFLQRRTVLNISDITIGKTTCKIEFEFNGLYKNINVAYLSRAKKIRINLPGSQVILLDSNNSRIVDFGDIKEQEPDNLIYPYLSKRKTVTYADTINEENANSVKGNFSNLYSKIDRLVTPQFQPGNKQYIEACENIVGFQVSTLAKGRGKQAVYFVHNLEHISLTAMGEGVANLLGLITDLCIAENKIFLIEEPENDIHPKALKALMKLIIEKSDTNQFFISTHSNIVMKYLGSVPDSKIFNVTNKLRDETRPNLFVSSLTEVSNNPEERRSILEDLGYDFFDFDLWKGWLFLEESSAEMLIRDYLIDWFVKPLKGKVRTFSAGGTSEIIAKFEDFDRLFVFLHLESTYKNKVWVIIDSGEEENIIIQKMKDKYVKSGWNETSFSQFTKHDFEKYYPAQFQAKVSEALSISNKQEKRKAKKELLLEVKNWINEHEEEAKEAFKESAKEVIEKLKVISKELNK